MAVETKVNKLRKHTVQRNFFAVHFSDTWQLIINKATTVVTFLMLFLIQNTKPYTKAVQFKLDELIRAVRSARNELFDLEDFSNEELRKVHEQFQQLCKKAEHDGNQRAHREQDRTLYETNHADFAWPVRRKTFPLGQSRNTSQFEQSGLRA